MKNDVVCYASNRALKNLTDGGNPALNFVNTYKRDHKAGWIDHLSDYSSFINWCEEAGLINEEMWTALDFEQYCCQKEAMDIYSRILSVRNCLDELFNYLLMGEELHIDTLNRFNDFVADARSHLRYQKTLNGPQLHWVDIAEEMRLPLWLIITAAAALFDTGNWQKIKKCPVCCSLFIDTSRRSNRRWCNIKTCGTLRIKNHYRLKSAAKRVVLSQVVDS